MRSRTPMPSRRLAAIAALLLAISAGGWLLPTARALSNASVVETGWWSSSLLAQPVADDGFAVTWSLDGEQAAAAVRIDASGGLEGTVYLSLHEAGGYATDQGLLEACLATEEWTAANPGAYADLPASDCDAPLQVGRDSEALTWLTDISALVNDPGAGVISLVLHPVGKPPADGVPATVPFEVQFDDAALLIDAPGGLPLPMPETTETTVGYDVGGTDSSYVPPLDVGSGFDSPDLEPVPTLPPAVTTPPTDPQTPDELVALGPVDATSSGSKPWGRLVLLVPLSAAVGVGLAAARRWQSERDLSFGGT